MTKENLATFLAQLTEAELQLKTPTFENLFNNVRYQTSNVQRSFEQFFDTLKTGTENNTTISKFLLWTEKFLNRGTWCRFREASQDVF